MKLLYKILICFLLIVLICGFFGFVSAAFNEQINYQGKLTNSAGVAVADGYYCIKFVIYDAACSAAPCGGSALWSEEWKTDDAHKVHVVNGLFSVLLGSQTSISSVDFNNASRYLEVDFDPACDNVYEEVFLPRKQMGAVPAAFEAKKLAGATWGAPGIIGDATPSTGTFSTLNFGASTGVSGTATNGVLTLLGLGDGQDENLTFDFNSTADTVKIGTGTGVTGLNLNAIGLTTTGSGTFGSLLANGYITQYNSSNTVTFSIKHDQTHFSDTLTEISAFANDGSPKMITMLGGLIVKDGDAVQPAYLYLSDYGESYKSWLTQESGTLTYHSATGTHSFGADNIITQGNIYNDIDNSKHYFGAGDDAYIAYTGTYWDFDIALATTATRFNQSQIDTNFIVYGDTAAIMTLDAGDLSATFGGTITATSFIIGANTLTTAEWAYLDGQDQAVKTTSSPTFDSLLMTTLKIGGATGVWGTATDGILTLQGKKAAGNNENLTFDFETTSNTVAIGTGTGVTGLNFNALNLTTTGTIYNAADNSKHYFGAANDASMYYDGTNLKINPKDVGAGYLDLLGSLYISGELGISLRGSGATGNWLMAGSTNTAGDTNFFFGYLSGRDALSTAAENIGLGPYTLLTLSSGDRNMGIGSEALRLITSGSDNVAVGRAAGYRAGTGSGSIYIGRNSGLYGTNANYSTYIGYYAGSEMNDCDYNVGIGSRALFASVNAAHAALTAHYNTGVGYYAGEYGSGAYNLYLGANAGRYETGSNTIIIDTLDRTDEATQRIQAPVYGITNATVASQSLTFNAGTINFNGGVDTDQTFNFTGTTTSGVLKWDEDNDYFLFSDDINAGSETITGKLITEYGTAAPTLATNGQLAVAHLTDPADDRLYFYSGSALKYISATGGFVIPNYETVDPISGEEMQEGDIVLGMLNQKYSDNAMHGIWVKWESVKAQLLAEARGELSASGTLGSGNVPEVETITLVERVSNVLGTIGISVVDGITNITNLAVQKFSADTATIKNLQMVDKTTGDIYCTWIEGGEWKKRKGECGTIVVEVATAPVEQKEVLPAEPVVSESAESTESTEEIVQQVVEQAIEQATEQQEQAVNEATQQAAEKIKAEIKQEVKQELQEEMKATEEQIPEEKTKTPKEEIQTVEEPAVEEAPVLEEPTATQEEPVSEPTVESIEEAPSIGDMIQESSAGILNNMWEFIKWFGLGIKNLLSLPIIQNEVAGLSAALNQAKKDVEISINETTPKIMEASSAGLLTPLFNLFYKVK